MSSKRAVTLHCPICKKTVAGNESDFPFCSERCRTIDLGKWARGDYVIPSPVTDIDEKFYREKQDDDGRDDDGQHDRGKADE